MALAAGTISIAGVSRSTVTLSATAATGGTGTVTYQWYRSPIYGFLPSAATLLSGETDLTLNDAGLAENTPYYYVLQATDTVLTTVSYPQLVVLTLSSSAAGYVYPQAGDFKAYFMDDFPFGTDPRTQFPDYRIANAMQQANVAFFNPDFFDNQASFQVGFLLLSAHYLVMNIRRASQGMKGQFGFLQNSKGAGVSVSVSIPERILENPDFAYLCQTNYGAEYLHMILPQLNAQVYAVPSYTNP